MAANNTTILSNYISNTDNGGDSFPVFGPYDYYADNDFIPHFYRVKAKWEPIFRGYFMFFIAIVVILSNTFMVMVFICRANRSQTTFVLSALAISDAIICTMRLPEAIYFNMAGNYKEYVPYRWCIANHGLYITYQIFRVSSNWITALLGCQRCLSVCLPLKFKRICTMRNTLIAVGSILLGSLLLNIYEMVAIEIVELKIWTTLDYNVSLPSGCLRLFSRSLLEQVGDKNKSMMLFYVFSGLIYRIIPVTILCVTTIILAYFLRKKSSVFKSKDSSLQNNKDAQYKRITRIAFIIMIVFLVAEIQDGIAFIIYSYELSQNKKRSVLSEEADVMWDTISTTMSMLGYACNFWIFFFMSQQFRTALIEMATSSFKKEKKVVTKMAFESSEKVSTASSKTNSSSVSTKRQGSTSI